MKRSRNINLDSMRNYAVQRVRVKPLALAIAAATLVACGSNPTEPALVYESVEQCIADNPALDIECRTSFRQAAEQAREAGPKYNSLADCQAEFGAQNCQPAQGPQGQSWFMPAMAGFMLGRALDGGGYRSAPLYSSNNPNSPAYGRWTSVDGRTYGNRSSRALRVDQDAFRPKPAVTRTMARGGFGSTVAAKSNWGGNRAGARSTRTGGWGG